MAGDPLAECEPVTTRRLDHKVAQTPWMVGQAGDDRRAAGDALIVQVINAGDTDVGSCGRIGAGIGRSHERQPHPVAMQQHQAHRGFVNLDLEAEYLAEECSGGREIVDLQIGATT